MLEALLSPLQPLALADNEILFLHNRHGEGVRGISAGYLDCKGMCTNDSVCVHVCVHVCVRTCVCVRARTPAGSGVPSCDSRLPPPVFLTPFPPHPTAQCSCCHFVSTATPGGGHSFYKAPDAKDLRLEGHTLSATATQLFHCHVKPATDNTLTHVCGRVPITLYL